MYLPWTFVSFVNGKTSSKNFIFCNQCWWWRLQTESDQEHSYISVSNIASVGCQRGHLTGAPDWSPLLKAEKGTGVLKDLSC